MYTKMNLPMQKSIIQFWKYFTLFTYFIIVWSFRFEVCNFNVSKDYTTLKHNNLCGA